MIELDLAVLYCPQTMILIGMLLMKKRIGKASKSVKMEAGGDENVIARVNGNDIQESGLSAYIQYRRIIVYNAEEKRRILEQYLSHEALSHAIESTCRANDKLVKTESDNIEKETIINRYFDDFLKEEITDEAVNRYYHHNIKQYESKKLHVSHILFRLNSCMAGFQRRAVFTSAHEAYSKIKAGMAFAKVAELYSEGGTSSENGGDLGWLEEGCIHDKFSEAAFSLDSGDVSKPIETPYGYHIIKIIDGVKITHKNFDAVKQDIRIRLRNIAQYDERKRLLETVKIEVG